MDENRLSILDFGNVEQCVVRSMIRHMHSSSVKVVSHDR